MESMDGTNVQRTNQHLYHRATKETIGKAQEGGKIYPWRRSSDVLLMPIWLGMTPRMPLCPSPKKATPIHPPLERWGLSGPSTVSLINNAVNSAVNLVLVKDKMSPRLALEAREGGRTYSS